MTSSYTQRPGDLSLELVTGDEFGMLVDVDFDVSGFSWTALVYEASTTNTFANPAGVTTQGATAATFTVTEVNAAAGQINLGLSEVQTAALSPTQTYRWFLRGVSPGMVTRTYLSGDVSIYAP